MRRIRTDMLTHFADLSDPKRVQKAVADLYEKHVQNENVRLIQLRSSKNGSFRI